jgi:hypothetical protein
MERIKENVMPALYAHLRFGEEVAMTLPAAYTALIERFPEAFALGTQGPDILFYHRPMKANDIRARGTFLHTWSGERFFLAQGKKLKSGEDVLTENGAFAAYLCGFLCHFTLDVLCHPYINAHSCEAVSHGKIESEFDKYVLRADSLPIRGYNTATPILDRNGTREAVAKALDVEETAIARSIKTMRKINGLFSKKCEAFHAFAHAFLKLAKMERKFGDMFLHKQDDPLCVEINQTLMEKFHSAIPQASALIQDYFHNIHAWVESQQSNQPLFRYNFSGIIQTEE